MPEIKKIDLALEDADLREVCDALGEKLKRNVIVEPDIHEKVTVTLRQIPGEQALEVIARLAKCKVEKRGALFVVTQAPANELHASNASASVVLEILAKVLGKSFAIGPGLGGGVACHLKRFEPAAALHALALANGWKLEESGGALSVAAGSSEGLAVADAPEPVPPVPAPEAALTDQAKLALEVAFDAACAPRATQDDATYVEIKIRESGLAGAELTASLLEKARARAARDKKSIDSLEIAVANGRFTVLQAAIRKECEDEAWTHARDHAKTLETIASDLPRVKTIDALITKGFADKAKAIAKEVAARESIQTKLRPRIVATFITGQPELADRVALAHGGDRRGQIFEDQAEISDGIRVAKIEPEAITFKLEDVTLRRTMHHGFDRWVAKPDASVADVSSSTKPEVAANGKNIDLTVEDTRLTNVVAEISKHTGQNIIVTPGIDERVTLSLRCIPWRDALDVIAKMTGCEVEEASGVLWITQPPKVSFEANASLGLVLECLSYASGENVVFPAGLTEKVSVSFERTHWLKALHAVAASGGLQVELHDGICVVRKKP